MNKSFKPHTAESVASFPFAPPLPRQPNLVKFKHKNLQRPTFDSCFGFLLEKLPSIDVKKAKATFFYPKIFAMRPLGGWRRD